MAPLLSQTQPEITSQILTEDVTNITNDDQTPMQQFYNNKTVFLTGGTGFLGKIIMEKLLRTCNLDNIYILVRAKKGKNTDSRIEEIFEDPVFERMKEINPKFRHKIIGITGDCILPGLGIMPNEREILKQNVNIVFHVAATVRFDEKLKMALGINVSGTKDIITLCKELNKLKSFVHVSTAFANCNRQNIDEEFYRPHISAENALKLADCLDDKTMDAITPELLKSYPNTYTFTKCLAEDLIRGSTKGLPVAIFRPAIVIPTYKEPIPGWIDNMYGPTGIMVGVGAGLVRVLHIEKTNNAEIVPVDMCVNSMLATAWDIGVNTYDEPPIYNYVPSTKNPLKWIEYCELALKYGKNVPLLACIWFYRLSMISSSFMNTILQFLYHTIPALIMDAGLIITGKKPKMLQIYKKVHRFCDVITYFSTGKWYFTNTNVVGLWQKLSEADKKLFFFDMEQLNWEENIKNNVFGIRTYLMKEDPKSIPMALKRMTRMKILHFTLLYSLYFIVLYFIYTIISWLFFKS